MHPLEGLKNHPKLRKLDIYAPDLNNLSADLPIIGSLNHLKQLHISQPSMNGNSLPSVDADLQLSSLGQLRNLSLSNLSFANVALPSGLMRLHVRYVNNCHIILPDKMPDLISFEAEASCLVGQLKAVAHFENIKHISLYNVTDDINLSELAKLPCLESLTLHLNGGIIPDLSAFRKLRFLNIFNIKGVDALPKIATASKLEDIYLNWIPSNLANRETIDLSVSDFNAFLGHPALKSLCITASTTDREIDKKIGEHLNVHYTLEARKQ